MKLVVIILVLKLMDSFYNVSADLLSFSEDILDDKLTIPLNTFYLLSKNKEKNFYYETTDQKVAEIKNGIIFPKEEGLIEINVFDKHNTRALTPHKTIKVTVVPKSEDTFDKLREFSNNILLDHRFYSRTDPIMSRLQKERDNKAFELWTTMNKEGNRSSLWYDETVKSSKHITIAYQNLQLLARTVMNEYSNYYLNRELLIDLLSGLEWMKNNKYNVNTPTYGDWYYWELGTPKVITETLTILYPIISKKDMSGYLSVIDRFLPDLNYRGSSLHPPSKIKVTSLYQALISRIKILQNILRKDGKGITDAKEALKKVFPFVKKGDGFYKDGSFLQNQNVPYTGSHGIYLLNIMSEIFMTIKSTEYVIADEEINNIFTWITEAFAPLMYKGNMMDMVRGRLISEQDAQSSIVGADVIRTIINFSDIVLSTNETLLYQKMAKKWILQNDAFDYIEHLNNYRDIYIAKQILNDPGIETNDVLPTMFKNYAIMNRVVYRNVEKDFALGISMSSKRIKRYESLNDENSHGWFTGDGMIYLYNSDLSQFNDDFWATVDPYRLPGITVDNVHREDGSGSSEATTNFVGASILDSRTGMVAMDFVNYGATVCGRKSWTVFDNKVIALGSGIKKTRANVVETIIENRKLNEAIKYKLYINSEEINFIKSFVYFESKVLVDRIYLEANDTTQSIGYQLLTPQYLTIKIENRKGAWSDISKGGSSTSITKKYLTIWKTHEVDNDNYNYVIYPGISKEEFDQEGSISLIQNNEYIHVIKDITMMESVTEKIGATIFNHGVYLIENMMITQPMILSRKDTANCIEIAVSDPTGQQVVPYVIKLTDRNYKIKEIDQNIQASLENGFWKIVIDPTNKLGQSSSISFILID